MEIAGSCRPLPRGVCVDGGACVGCEGGGQPVEGADPRPVGDH